MFGEFDTMDRIPEASLHDPAVAAEPLPMEKAKKKSKGVRFQSDEADMTSHRTITPTHGLERRSSRPKASEALDNLLAGNRRFREGKLERCIGGSDIIKETAEDDAKPRTVILSCSDSRAPPEIICDMGLGDSHVVRVGGNVVNDFVMGSIMFAVQHVGCTLVLVLAHSRCSVVASAVQSWARGKTSLPGGDEARSLAETVQQTLGHVSPSLSPTPAAHKQAGPSPPSKPAVKSGTPSTDKPSVDRTSSPFAAMSTQPYKDSTELAEPPASEKREGFFAKCCSCFSPDQPEVRAPDAVSGASTPMRTQGQGTSEKRRISNDGRQSEDRSNHSRGINRHSINPLHALVSAIGGVVEHVASSGQHESLKGLARKERQKDSGYDSDDADLKRGLQKADSLDFTRARLAKTRQEKRMESLRILSERGDVDCIIDENAKASAMKILMGLIKNLDENIVEEVEVVAAKYDIADGSVRVLSRNWFSSTLGTIQTSAS